MKSMDALEKIFGTTAQMMVLKNLIKHQSDLTYLSRIAKETGFSNSIVSKVIIPLVESGIVIEEPLGTLRTFHLNPENEATNLILDFYHKLNQLVA
jgi:hypothetical protein